MHNYQDRKASCISENIAQVSKFFVRNINGLTNLEEVCVEYSFARLANQFSALKLRQNEFPALIHLLQRTIEMPRFNNICQGDFIWPKDRGKKLLTYHSGLSLAFLSPRTLTMNSPS